MSFEPCSGDTDCSSQRWGPEGLKTEHLDEGDGASGDAGAEPQ